MEGVEEGGEIGKEVEVAPALISVHPHGRFVVVAVGPELRVFDLEGECAVSLTDNSGGPSHSDSIRSVKFGANGRLFASAGDDKLVKVWATDSWQCVSTVSSEKRVSALGISHDGQFVAFADKFGVVWVVGLDDDGTGQLKGDKKPVSILGHYCSIITSLEFSPDGRFITTADRDFKIRVTVFPKDPLKGAHEIQSFCLGHTDFVSCLAFTCPANDSQGFLISGGGDSTVRLWDFESGKLLDTCKVGGEKAGLPQLNGAEMEDHPAVTDLCSLYDGSLIAVAIQRLPGVMILKNDFSSRTLSIAKVVMFEEDYFPTKLSFSSSSQCLWSVMGASNLPTSDATQLFARIKVVSGFNKNHTNSIDLVVKEDGEVPGGEKLLCKLQGTSNGSKEAAALAAVAAALKVSIHNQLTKKHYSFDRREMRKRNRNDKKLK